MADDFIVLSHTREKGGVNIGKKLPSKVFGRERKKSPEIEIMPGDSKYEEMKHSAP